MTPTIAILAHYNLDRVAQMVQFLSDKGLNVCVHVDQSVSANNFNNFKSSLSSCPDILWAKRFECEWGQFSLVEATLGMAAEILENWQNAGHVMLISGDSLPVRAPAEFIAFLQENPDVDFIESVAIGNDNWITGGLGIERFTLSFPFSWKKQRWLFDMWVEVQRKLRLTRRIPNGLRPHIGSQWWCLSRQTLEAILNDPAKPQNDAYFRKCWIPDESYFQTLARKHARTIESRSLLFSRFDHQGKPTALYDDHADLLGSIDAFFARKIWAGATELYQRFLNPLHETSADAARPIPNFERIDTAANRRKTGRSGLYMHGRAPSQWYEEYSPTAKPYHIFTGFNAVFPDFNGWQNAQSGVRPHGCLFAESGAQFVNGELVGPGGISSSAAIRDLAPENFLCNLVWNTRDKELKFHYEICDLPNIGPFLLADPHANLHFIRHGWMLDLLNRNIENADYLRTNATTMIDRERSFISALQQSKTNCTCNVWTLGEVLSNPQGALSATLGEANVQTPLILPEMADASRLTDFARDLKNIGIDIDDSLLEPPAVSAQANTDLKAQQ